MKSPPSEGELHALAPGQVAQLSHALRRLLAPEDHGEGDALSLGVGELLGELALLGKDLGRDARPPEAPARS